VRANTNLGQHNRAPDEGRARASAGDHAVALHGESPSTRTGAVDTSPPPSAVPFPDCDEGLHLHRRLGTALRRDPPHRAPSSERFRAGAASTSHAPRPIATPSHSAPARSTCPRCHPPCRLRARRRALVAAVREHRPLRHSPDPQHLLELCRAGLVVCSRVEPQSRVRRTTPASWVAHNLAFPFGSCVGTALAMGSGHDPAFRHARAPRASALRLHAEASTPSRQLKQQDHLAADASQRCTDCVFM
jgi:hypothetical protein